jgi:hypothetical protein
MEIAALCFVSLAAGLVIGYEWADHRRRKADMAPLPDFDPQNPINQRFEPVEICGRTMYRMN